MPSGTGPATATRLIGIAVLIISGCASAPVHTPPGTAESTDKLSAPPQHQTSSPTTTQATLPPPPSHLAASPTPSWLGDVVADGEQVRADGYLLEWTDDRVILCPAYVSFGFDSGVGCEASQMIHASGIDPRSVSMAASG
jgi:hypothetical protein